MNASFSVKRSYSKKYAPVVAHYEMLSQQPDNAYSYEEAEKEYYEEESEEDWDE